MITSEKPHRREEFYSELAKWIRNFREAWFEKSEYEWNRLSQFIFAFLGALTFFAAFSIFPNTDRTIPLVAELFGVFYIQSLIAMIVFSAYFGIILAWRPRKTGPVRVYLSGVTLPALTMFIVSLPYRF